MAKTKKDNVWRKEVLKVKSLVLMSKEGKTVTISSKAKKERVSTSLKDSDIVAYFGRAGESCVVLVDMSYKDLVEVGMSN